MFVRIFACSTALLALAFAAPPLAAAAPGDTLAAERTRLAADRGLAPLEPMAGDPARYQAAPPVPADTMPGGREGWNVSLIVRNGIVTSESLAVQTPGRPYAIFSDGKALAVRAFGAAIAADLAASRPVGTERQDPDIATTTRRGARYAYRIVDDARNGIHLIEVTAPAQNTAPAESIYAVGYSGMLAPIGVRTNGAFRPLADDGAPPRRVHVIFGNRTIATVTTAIANGRARVAIPASVRLSGVDNALASPSFGGSAMLARRAPTPGERAAVLQLAAQKLHATAAGLQVRALTALDLGAGMAIAGTVNLRGTATPRVDERLFFIAEARAGTWTLTHAAVQRVTVSEPLLEETAEMLIDALDLGGGTVGVVTRIIGFDASTYAIYTRSGAGWKAIFTGGGAAN